jgi:hypothetical protein
MIGLNSGLIGARRVPTLTTGSGLWVANEQVLAKRANIWPLGPNEIPSIGNAFQGGFFAGYISHTANGVATHALIVAPRATGASGAGYPVTTSLTVRTTAAPTTGSSSLFNGVANTDNMAAIGLALFPAAQFCRGLSIGGYTDWYLPSVLELDIIYKNLKPSTESNSTSFGTNAYAVPPRDTNHTAGDPARTSVAIFQAPSGSERFESQPGGDNHWSSTITSAGSSNAWRFGMSNGFQQSLGVDNPQLVRAIRRVAL